MIRKTKKGALFLLSMIATGLLGMIGGYSRTHFSKSESLFMPTAFADGQNYTGGGGDTCGGCTSDGGPST